MGRTAKDRRRYAPKPVEKAVLSEKHTGLRLAAVILLLAGGAAALSYALMSLLTPDEGWQRVEVSASSGLNCGSEFVFLYRMSGPSSERKALQLVYSSACETAYRLFDSSAPAEGGGLSSLNAHPNEVLTVEPALYEAFSLLEKSGSRRLYLGTAAERWDDLFFCQSDAEAAEFDPYQNAALQRELAELARFAQDESAVSLELLGEGQVKLSVSAEYLAYAESEGLSRFIDFGWLKNAFIADYLADAAAAEGFTQGAVSSYDGFTRCLDESGEEYALPLYQETDGGIAAAEPLRYQGPMGLVTLRRFMLAEIDRRAWYAFEDGRVLTSYLDTADGLPKAAKASLTAYGEQSCAEIALAIADLYIADDFDEAAAEALASEGLTIIW